MADMTVVHHLPCSLGQLERSVREMHAEAVRQQSFMEAATVAVDRIEADARMTHAALSDERSARHQAELTSSDRLAALASAEERLRVAQDELIETREAAALSAREAHAAQVQAADRLAASAQLQQEQAAHHAAQLQAVVRAAREQELVAAEAALHDLSAGLRRLCGRLLPQSAADDSTAFDGSVPEVEPSVALARQALRCLERLQAAQLPGKLALQDLHAELQLAQQVACPAAPLRDTHKRRARLTLRAMFAGEGSRQPRVRDAARGAAGAAASQARGTSAAADGSGRKRSKRAGSAAGS